MRRAAALLAGLLLAAAGACAGPPGSPLPRGPGKRLRWYAVPRPIAVLDAGGAPTADTRFTDESYDLAAGESLLVAAEPGTVLRVRPDDAVVIERLHPLGPWVAATREPSGVVPVTPGLSPLFRVTAPADAPVRIDAYRQVERDYPERWEHLEDRAREALAARLPGGDDLPERAGARERDRAFAEEVAALVPWEETGEPGTDAAARALVLAYYYLHGMPARSDDGRWAFDEHGVDALAGAAAIDVPGAEGSWLEPAARGEPVALSVTGPGLLRLQTRLLFAPTDASRYQSYRLTVREGERLIARPLVWTAIDDEEGPILDEKGRLLGRERRDEVLVPPGSHRYEVAADRGVLVSAVLWRKRHHAVDALRGSEDPEVWLARARDHAERATGPHALYLLAAIALESGDIAGAEAHLAAFDAASPEDARLALAAERLRARILAGRGAIDEAIARLEVALERATAGLLAKRARVQLGELRLAAGRPDRAADEYERLLADEPDDVGTRLRCVEALLESPGDRSRDARALAHAQELLERSPGLPEGRRLWRAAYYAASYWQAIAPAAKPDGPVSRIALPLEVLEDERLGEQAEVEQDPDVDLGAYAPLLGEANEATFRVLPDARFLLSASASGRAAAPVELMALRRAASDAVPVVRLLADDGSVVEVPLLPDRDHVRIELPLGAPLELRLDAAEGEPVPDLLLRGPFRAESLAGPPPEPVVLATFYPLARHPAADLSFRFEQTACRTFLRGTVLLEGDAPLHGATLHLEVNGAPWQQVRLGLPAIEETVIAADAPAAPVRAGARIHRFVLVLPPGADRVTAALEAAPGVAGFVQLALRRQRRLARGVGAAGGALPLPADAGGAELPGLAEAEAMLAAVDEQPEETRETALIAALAQASVAVAGEAGVAAEHGGQNPLGARARIVRGEALLRLDEPRLALSDLLLAREMAPPDSAERARATARIGLAYRVSGEASRSLSYHEEALAAGVDERAMRLALAGALVAARRPAAAVAQLVHWTEAHPGDGEAWLALARARVEAGEPPSAAAADLGRAAAAAPEGSAVAREARYRLGVLAYRRGDVAAASEAFGALVAEDATDGPGSAAGARLSELRVIASLEPARAAVAGGAPPEAALLAELSDAAAFDETWPLRVVEDAWQQLRATQVVEFARRARVFSRQVAMNSYYYAVGGDRTVTMLVEGPTVLRVEARPDCRIGADGRPGQSGPVRIWVDDGEGAPEEATFEPVDASRGLAYPDLVGVAPGFKRATLVRIGPGLRRVRIGASEGSAHVRGYVLRRPEDLFGAGALGAGRLHAWVIARLSAAEDLGPVGELHLLLARARLGLASEAERARLGRFVDQLGAAVPAPVRARVLATLGREAEAIAAYREAIAAEGAARPALYRAELGALLVRGDDPEAALPLVQGEDSIVPRVSARVRVAQRLLALARRGRTDVLRPHTRAYVRLAQERARRPDSVEVARGMREALRGARWERVTPTAAPAGAERVVARERGLSRYRRVRERLFGEEGFAERGQLVTRNRGLELIVDVAEPTRVLLRVLPRALLDGYLTAVAGAGSEAPWREASLSIVVDGEQVAAPPARSGAVVVHRTAPLPAGRHRIELHLKSDYSDVVASVVAFTDRAVGDEEAAFTDDQGNGWYGLADEASLAYFVAGQERPVQVDLLGPTVLRLDTRFFLDAAGTAAEPFAIEIDVTDPRGATATRRLELVALRSPGDRFRHLRSHDPSRPVQTEHRLDLAGAYRLTIRPVGGRVTKEASHAARIALRMHALNDRTRVDLGDPDAEPDDPPEAAAPHAVGLVAGAAVPAARRERDRIDVAWRPDAPPVASAAVAHAPYGAFPERRGDHGTWSFFSRVGVEDEGEGRGEDDRANQDFVSLGVTYRRHFEPEDVYARLRLETFFIEKGASPGVKLTGRFSWRTPFAGIRLGSLLTANFQEVESEVENSLEGRIEVERDFRFGNRWLLRPTIAFQAVEQSLDRLRGLDADEVWFDVFNGFDRDHRRRLIAETELRYRPFLDLELFARGGGFTNEELDPGDLDRVYYRAGIRGYHGPFFWEAHYFQVFRFDDDDRREAFDDRRVTGRFAYWGFPAEGLGITIEARVDWFINDEEVDALFGIRFHLHRGRVLEDFDPSEMSFRDHFDGWAGSREE